MRIYSLILAFILFSAPVFGADANDELINRIQNAYGNINAFNAAFDQMLTHKESGSKEKRSGSIKFQKPLNIRWETKKPNEELLVINSREIWNYLPDEQLAYRYSPTVAQDSRSVLQVITGQARLNKDFKIKRLGMENGLVKLALFPKEPTTDMVEAAIWVDPATGIIQRASVTDFYGNLNDIAFQSFKPTASIPDASFNFKAPKGVEIEDRIGSEVQERNLFK